MELTFRALAAVAFALSRLPSVFILLLSVAWHGDDDAGDKRGKKHRTGFPPRVGISIYLWKTPVLFNQPCFDGGARLLGAPSGPHRSWDMR